MIVYLRHGDADVPVDLHDPIDLSIPMVAGENTLRAWYLPPLTIEPVVMDGFVGDVNQGGSVNFRNIGFNPHGHSTHTECVGHISAEPHSVNQAVKQFFLAARLISVAPNVKDNGDRVIGLDQLQSMLPNGVTEALLVRTLPNELSKKQFNYSHTNPPYVEAEAATWLREQGVMHLLIDTPSVDREEDGGALAAHRAFWNYPEATAALRTITEMFFAPAEVADGDYLLNLQFAPFENDASPSRPVLYNLPNFLW
ncbi:MAG: cyclase family protein [Salibacteraceae bacterium]